MLVLSRKCGESITIPDIGITITLVAIEGNRVRLGFEGPREVAVIRQKGIREPQAEHTKGRKTPRPAPSEKRTETA